MIINVPMYVCTQITAQLHSLFGRAVLCHHHQVFSMADAALFPITSTVRNIYCTQQIKDIPLFHRNTEQ